MKIKSIMLVMAIWLSACAPQLNPNLDPKAIIIVNDLGLVYLTNESEFHPLDMQTGPDYISVVVQHRVPGDFPFSAPKWGEPYATEFARDSIKAWGRPIDISSVPTDIQWNFAWESSDGSGHYTGNGTWLLPRDDRYVVDWSTLDSWSGSTFGNSINIPALKGEYVNVEYAYLSSGLDGTYQLPDQRYFSDIYYRADLIASSETFSPPTPTPAIPPGLSSIQMNYYTEIDNIEYYFTENGCMLFAYSCEYSSWYNIEEGLAIKKEGSLTFYADRNPLYPTSKIFPLAP